MAAMAWCSGVAGGRSVDMGGATPGRRHRPDRSLDRSWGYRPANGTPARLSHMADPIGLSCAPAARSVLTMRADR